MVQMASIFTYGPLLGPPSHHRGDEEEKITLQRESAVQQVWRVPQSHGGLGHIASNLLESPVDIFRNCSLIFRTNGLHGDVRHVTEL